MSMGEGHGLKFFLREKKVLRRFLRVFTRIVQDHFKLNFGLKDIFLAVQTHTN